MKVKSMVVATLCMLLPAGQAASGLVPDQDSFGVYFDTVGNAMETSVGPFTPYNAYLLVLNPSAPIDAFECTVTRVGGPCYVLSQDLGEGAVDADATADGFRVTRATPYPVLYGAVVLANWMWMQQSWQGMWVFIGPGSDPLLPGGLPVLGSGGTYRQGVIWTGSDGFPVACVNVHCVSADEPTTFGALKSLYR